MKNKVLMSIVFTSVLLLSACSSSVPAELTSISTNAENSGDLMLQKQQPSGNGYLHYNTGTGFKAKNAKKFLSKGTWEKQEIKGLAGSFKFTFSGEPTQIFHGSFVEGDSILIVEENTGYSALFEDDLAKELYDNLFDDKKKISDNY